MTAAPASDPAPIPTWLVGLLATAAGLVVANLYYAQPLAGPISAALGLAPGSAGLIVTATQAGYVLGLLLVVPAADLVENLRLIVGLLAVATVGLLVAALSTHPAPFLLACLCIGLGSVAVQVMVPYASHLVPEAIRGRVVGTMLSGLMLGIMLARPVSSLLAEFISWHAVFYVSAVLMVVLAGVLWLRLPPRRPESGLSYGALLRSMGELALTTPVLQRRALYQFFLFAAFSLFWTVIPLLLAGPVFRLSQGGIALFALAGVAGAVSAPLAGGWADRGLTRPASAACMVGVAVAFGLTHLGAPGGAVSLGFLVAAAILLDFGVTANLTLGQRAIFMLGAAQRGRLNGLYLATFFVGGAVGSALGGWAYAHGGWVLASTVGLALPLLALGCFATERREA